MNVKVSVIVPTYNAENTINSCINSILNQTLKEIEIIVINDGSTDKTKEILEKITDGRVKLIHTENNGQGSARNLGISVAKGELIGFVDSDDLIHETMYEMMSAKIGSADICQCNILNIYKDGKYTRQLAITNETVTIKNRRKYFDEYLFKAKHSYECCNKLIKRSFLIENDIVFFDNKDVYSEDLLFNLQIAKKLNRIVFVDELFYYYYQNENSHSKKNSIEKIRKLCHLFEIAFEDSYKYEISKIAVLIIMLNLSHINSHYSEILERDDVKKYLWLSFLSMTKIRHKIIMLMLIYMPIKMKKRIILLYYSNLK